MAGVLSDTLEVDAQPVAQRMGEATTDFLASLTEAQKAKAVFDFDQEQKRTFWHYTPIPRDGLPLAEMERHQQRLAYRLVAAGLSQAGFVVASTIMGLETTLDAKERWFHSPFDRDSRLYYLRIFGTPSDQAPWGWSFEGHHLSLNYTLVDGRMVAPTPTFFGANPADSPLGSSIRLRPLPGIEDLARDLMHSLDEEQRARAVIAAAAPPDMVLTNGSHVVEGALLADPAALAEWQAEQGVRAAEVEALRYSATPKGISSHALNRGQQQLLMALVAEYIRRMPDELAELELRKLQQEGATPLHFAWAGGLERGQGHYYRIQNSRFLVEYDNTQNDANHIHSVWRNPHDDFGAGILARHYAHHH